MRRARVDLRIALASLVIAGWVIVGGSTPAAADGDPFFVFGPQDVGLSVAYGRGTSITTSGHFEGHDVEELVLIAHWQLVFTRMPLAPAWYKGVLALRIEPTVWVNLTPRTGVAGGATAMLRFEWTGFGRTRPFFEAGAGVLGLDFDIVDQADGLAFDPTAGVGIVQRLGDRLSVQGSVRFQHFSNAYTRSPNGGIDAFQYGVGVILDL